MRIGLKFCGSCNPKVDLEGIDRKVRAWAERGGHEIVALDSDDLGLIIIVNGCERACADRPEVRHLASRIVVAGTGAWKTWAQIRLE